MCAKGTKLKVKIEDLPHGSNIKVIIQCDCCKKIYKKSYSEYILHNHQGNTYCQECANTVLFSGENSPRWNFFKTEEERIIGRKIPEYSSLVKRTFIRDNYTCQCCGKEIHQDGVVHHLNSYDWCIDGRLDITNCILICENCHKNYHSIYGYGQNTREQYEEWIGYTLPLLINYNGNLPTARQVYDIEENKIYKSVKEYCDIHNVKDSNVYACCNHKTTIRKMIKKNGDGICYENRVCVVDGHHLLWLDEYEKMTKEDLQYYLQKFTNKTLIKIICITTGQFFNSINEAAQYYGIDRRGIGDCCRGRYKFSGKLNGVPLKWMYLSDFKKLSQEEQEKILTNVKEELS